ncbi:MAG: carboxypeptidase regulatory-like domain-containing protein [bacterium]|nr:carboxypeptidase regulatory-like domain-containing protein [bacterium]
MKYFKVCFVTGFLTLVLTNAFSAEKLTKHTPWFMEKFEKSTRIQTPQDSSFMGKGNNTFFQSGDTLGVIMGTVTDIYSNPIKNIQLVLYDTTCHSYGYSSNWATNSLGQYVVSGTSWGYNTHKLRAGNANTQGYINEWYNNKYYGKDANVLTLYPLDTLKNIDFILEIGGCISGYVTGTKGAINGISIAVYDITTGDQMSSCYTDSTGHYIAMGLPTADYKVTANGKGYIAEWYDNATNGENAVPVSVTMPDTTKNINFELQLGGCISGYVTISKRPLQHIYVNVYNATTKDQISGSYTDSTGYYIITTLPTGSYKVKTRNDSGYVDLYWNNKPDWNSADLVNLTMPDTAKNINFSLYVGGKIKGKVYGTKGPIKNIDVDAFNTNSGESVKWGMTDSTGSYRINSLPTGYYKIWAAPGMSGVEDTLHAIEWYNDKNNWWSADSIYVAAPDSVLNIDFTLEQGGFISGTVYGSPKSQIAGAVAIAWGYINDFYGWFPLVGDETDANGKYLLKTLRTGNYKIMAFAEGYGILWYNQKPDSNSANLVSVATSDTTSGIDFNLTGVEETKTNKLPLFLQVTQNPFIKSTIISYSLHIRTKVSLSIYDLSGRMIKTLVNEEKEAGGYTLSLNAKDLLSGIYFVKLTAGEYKETKKLILMK